MRFDVPAEMMFYETRYTFNSLYEIQEVVTYFDLKETIELSILSMRFIMKAAKACGGIFSSFNSLYEILMKDLEVMRASMTPSFNSLYEIQSKRRMLMKFDRVPFNSLYEIPKSTSFSRSSITLSILSMRFHGRKDTDAIRHEGRFQFSL